MATVTWGNTGTVWTTAANWSGGVPGAADTALMIDGSTSVDGVDQASINLAKLAIGGGYVGQVGSSATYLTISADEVSIQSGVGGKDIYLDSGGTDAHDDIRIDSAAPANSQTIYLKATTTCPKLTIIRGNVVLVSGTFTKVFVAYEGTGTVPNVTVEDATVTNWYGEEKVSACTTGSCTITNLYHNSGLFQADTSATLTNIWLRGGTIIDNSIATTTFVQQSGRSNFYANTNLQGKQYDEYIKLGGQSSANLSNGLSTIVFGSPGLTTESGNPPLQ